MENSKVNPLYIIIAIIILLAGASFFFINQSSEDSTNTTNTSGSEQDSMDKESDSMEKDSDAMEKDEHNGDAMMEDKMDKDDAMMEADKMDKDDAMMEDDKMDKDDETSQSSGPGVFTSYSPDNVSNASTENVVIFFAADWCPSCQVLKRDIEANESSIPANLTILEANYDDEVDLKKTHGVTYQHTMVQVDKDGNQLKKWSGGFNLDDIASEVI